jgi:hypothetical protein
MKQDRLKKLSKKNLGKDVPELLRMMLRLRKPRTPEELVYEFGLVFLTSNYRVDYSFLNTKLPEGKTHKDCIHFEECKKRIEKFDENYEACCMYPYNFKEE